ncbi:hypothetical protein ABK040_002309 [Willaertia magna]
MLSEEEFKRLTKNSSPSNNNTSSLSTTSDNNPPLSTNTTSPTTIQHSDTTASSSNILPNNTPTTTTSLPTLQKPLSRSSRKRNTNQQTQNQQSSSTITPTTTSSSITSITNNLSYEKAEIKQIPKNEKFTMIIFPGNVKNVNNALEMMGGLKRIQSNDNKFLECRFRPNNLMSCHPIHADVMKTNHLLVRIRRKKISVEKQSNSSEDSLNKDDDNNKEEGLKRKVYYDKNSVQLEVIGTINKTVQFKGMSDFQYIHNNLVNLNQSMDDDGVNHAENNTDKEDFSVGGGDTESIYSETNEILNDNNNQQNNNLNNRMINNNNQYYNNIDELSDAVSTITPINRASVNNPYTGKENSKEIVKLDLPPPIFSRFDLPMDYAFKQNPASEIVPIISHDGSSKKYKRLIKKNKQYTPACIEINFEDPIPERAPPEVENRKDRNSYLDVEEKLKYLFGYYLNKNNNSSGLLPIEEGKSRKIRPIWSRGAITSQFECMKDRYKLRFVLPRVAYHYRDGPWRSLWVRYGFDPKKEESIASYYQLLDFRVPYDLKSKITNLSGRKKHELESNNFRRLPRRKPTIHADLQEYLYSADEDHFGDKANSSANQHHYEFNSIPTQIQTFYQLCDIRIASVQSIVLADKDEEILLTYGGLPANAQHIQLREKVWLQNDECDSKSGWYSIHALEQIRHLMKKKVEYWLEKGGEENDKEILSDTDEDEDNMLMNEPSHSSSMITDNINSANEVTTDEESGSAITHYSATQILQQPSENEEEMVDEEKQGGDDIFIEPSSSSTH